ncbi:MAG TPA: 3-hydroxyacyl-CoA dehydrogenase NAD-binding domain-containing protein [Acidimicrobiales bacterium]|nr:3-hydroxyacyl-CoA dehydrogenase NAD-binding domain-containing protein [Acidimicrobiales bacterium]
MSGQVGVVGAGTMGLGIAEVAAVAGFDVVVWYVAPETAESVAASLRRSLARRAERGALAPEAADAARGRCSATAALSGLAGCGLVVEAVVEDLATKQAIFVELDRHLADTAVLATNTSTLSVAAIAASVRRPERVCGIHFFNPAPVMALVEVARPAGASEATIDAALAFVRACGKTPVEVADRPGFIVNALLFPYLNGAVRMLADGVAAADAIDAAMVGGCNMPIGPLHLLDLIGLDTSVAILDALAEATGDPAVTAVPLLRELVAAGRLGRKSGAGFFAYGAS